MYLLVFFVGVVVLSSNFSATLSILIQQFPTNNRQNLHRMHCVGVLNKLWANGILLEPQNLLHFGLLGCLPLISRNFCMLAVNGSMFLGVCCSFLETLGSLQLIYGGLWMGAVFALLAHQGLDVALLLAPGLRFGRGMDYVPPWQGTQTQLAQFSFTLFGSHWVLGPVFGQSQQGPLKGAVQQKQSTSAECDKWFNLFLQFVRHTGGGDNQRS